MRSGLADPAVRLGRAASTALVLATALLAGACTGDEYVAPTPAASAEVADPAAAAATLAALQRAVTDADPSAAEALGADDPAADLLSAVVDNASALGLTDVTFRYVTETGRTTGSDGWEAQVALTWRFDGFDAASARIEVPVSFAEQGRRIAAVGGSLGRLPVWLTGPVAVRNVPGGVVLAADPEADVAAYARMVRRAVVEARSVVGGRVGLVVEVPADTADLHRALGADPGRYHAIAAVTAPVDGSRAPGSPVHVFVNPAVFDDLDAVAAQVVMTHEAVHAVTGAALANDAPLWLVEGFADYVALRDVRLPAARTAGQVIEQVRDEGLPEALPADTGFDPTGSHLGAVYEAAWQATVVLAERGGEDALVDLYRQVLDGAGLARPLRSAFDWSLADLTAAWRARLAGLAGLSG